MTRAKNYQRYSPEFKKETLKRASADGMTDKQVSKELGVSPRQIARWRDELRLNTDVDLSSKGVKKEEEFIKLKKELAKVKQERDFLKSAVVFFAKESE